MGFFDSIMKKRQCSICGKEMGLTERKELSGGNLCDDCADKLSDWFSTDARKRSTPQQIQEQLAYREQNRQAVAQFRATRTIGRNTKVYLDEMNRKFMVSGASNLQEDNPDVIDASAITNVAVDIDESKHELRTKNEEGRSVSYNPPRYDYSYDFYVDIDVSHPYCSHRRIKVNSGSVWIKYDYLQSRGLTGFGGNHNSFNTGADTSTAAGILGAVINGLQNSINANNPNVVYPPEYRENLAIAEDIRFSLLNLRQPGSAVPNPAMGMNNGMGTVGGVAGMAGAGMAAGMQQGYPGQMPPQGYPGQMPPQGYPGQMPPQGYPGQMPQQGYPGQMPQQGYPGQMPPQGYPGQMPPQGYPGQMPPQGYPGQMPQQGYPGQMPQQGYPGQMPPQGYPGQMPPQGYPGQMPQQGYPQQPEQPQADAATWYCPNCGAPNQGQFCMNCGTPKP